MAGDTISTGSGDDIVNGSLGDDTIIVDGSGNKDINGGIGSDTLQLSLPGVSGIEDLVSISYPIVFYENSFGLSNENLPMRYWYNESNAEYPDYIQLTADDGSITKVTSIENIEIGGDTYKVFQPYPDRLVDRI